MPKKRKEETDEIEIEVEDSEQKKINIPKPKVNINKVVADTRAIYEKDKTKKALAKDLVTGNEITLSQNVEDYVTSQEIQAFWKPLTGLIGHPYGRITQVAGKPDSGKSTLAMMMMIAAQASGTVVILWDSENKFSSRRFQKMGGVPEYVLVARGRTIIEGAIQVSRYVKQVKEQDPDTKILIVWDSVGATDNSKEDNEDTDDHSNQPGVTAKEVTWAIKKLNKICIRNRNMETGTETVGVVCVNQIYANIGSVGYTEKGGQELYYLSSVILQLARKSDLTRVRGGEKMKYGITTRAKVRKNHLFDGEECISELDLVVSADGIILASELKKKAKVVGESEWVVESD